MSTSNRWAGGKLLPNQTSGVLPNQAIPRFRRQRGFTLIEVLLAAAILVIGVFAILRVFPRGLTTLDTSRSQSIGAQLAEAEIERHKLNPGSLPDAIIATDYGGVAINSYDPEDLTPNQGRTGVLGPADGFPANTPATAGGWEPDSLYWPRVVIGEPVRVPSVTASPATFGVPFHVLNFAPLDYYSSTVLDAGPPPVYETVQVYNATPLQRTTSSPPAYGYYNVDYSTGLFTFYNADGYQYKIDYSWVDGSGVHTRVGEWTTRVTETNPWTYTVAAAAGWGVGGGIIQRSERVYQLLPYDPTPGPTGPAAGHYYIDPTSGRVTGVVYFNPQDAGANLKIDYRVADWAILREDVQVPADSLNPEGLGGLVKLAITNIRGPGFVSPPRHLTTSPLYLKLHPDLLDGTYLVAIDLSNGTALVNGPAVDSSHFVVNYQTGELYFNNASVNRSGHSFRVFFRGQDDWGVQAAKANANYVPFVGIPPDWDKFTINGVTLTFAPTEAGKSVLVDYRWQDLSSLRYNVVQGELHRIAQDGTVALLHTPTSVQRVRGVSFNARVSWVGPGAVRAKTAAGAPGSHMNEAWRQVTVDSYLTRPASER